MQLTHSTKALKRQGTQAYRQAGNAGAQAHMSTPTFVENR